MPIGHIGPDPTLAALREIGQQVKRIADHLDKWDAPVAVDNTISRNFAGKVVKLVPNPLLPIGSGELGGEYYDGEDLPPVEPPAETIDRVI